MPEPIRTIHVLLIGIDSYKPNPWYQDLKGCVRDIDLVSSHLEKALKVSSEQIYKLTSPHREDSALLEARSVFKPGVLPTYENIVAAFQEVTEKAKP
ncbi:caspase family protein [Cyanobacteria bacterium FACHB-63]|nr:caspase family protein [Cyanobacteria bacterium FACHB-63]